MNRREFVRHSTMALLLAGTLRASRAEGSSPEIALTFDDPRTEGGAGLTWQELNERILSTLARNKLKTILFVCGKRIDSAPGRELVSAWDTAGHLIGNHSYSHLNFNDSNDDKITLPDFEADALKNEPLIRGYSHFTRLFRYPFLKEGDTSEKRDGMRAFLREHGYRIGRSTIDASDWAIDTKMNKRAEASRHADLSGYRDFYLQHIWERSEFYNSLAQRVITRPVRHTVVLHHNALNALFLDDLIALFRKKGWTMVDAEYAYRDDVYDRQPKILPAGESLIWALAKESGKFEKELRYPGEDDVYENPRMDALNL